MRPVYDFNLETILYNTREHLFGCKQVVGGLLSCRQHVHPIFFKELHHQLALTDFLALTSVCLRFGAFCRAIGKHAALGSLQDGSLIELFSATTLLMAPRNYSNSNIADPFPLVTHLVFPSSALIIPARTRALPTTIRSW